MAAAAGMAIVTAAVPQPVAADTQTPTAPATVVLDWYTQAWTSIAIIEGKSPWDAEVGVAMAQGAVYDAVNGIVRSHQPYLVMPAAHCSPRPRTRTILRGIRA